MPPALRHCFARPKAGGRGRAIGCFPSERHRAQTSCFSKSAASLQEPRRSRHLVRDSREYRPLAADASWNQRQFERKQPDKILEERPGYGSTERTKVTRGTEISQAFCYAEPGFWRQWSFCLPCEPQTSNRPAAVGARATCYAPPPGPTSGSQARPAPGITNLKT